MLWGTGIGQFFFSILKQHTVNKGTRVYGTCRKLFKQSTLYDTVFLKISDYFRVLFFLNLLVYTVPQIMVFCAVNL